MMNALHKLVMKWRIPRYTSKVCHIYEYYSEQEQMKFSSHHLMMVNTKKENPSFPNLNRNKKAEI